MKYLKKYEKYVDLEKLVDLTKIKKYIITKSTDENIYWVDEILELNKKSDVINLKTLIKYDCDKNTVTVLSELDDVFFTYLNNVIFSSNDFDETKEYFNSIVDRYRNAKKYNI